MPEVVDHLAELTGFRDRDVVDVTLVSAFRDLLQPDSVAIYRPVGEPQAQRWLTRARLRAHETTPAADSVWTELEDLPPLATMPHHQRCLREQAPLSVKGAGGAISLFPLATEREVAAVLDIRTRDALSDEQRRLVCSILRVYRNFQGLLDYSERDTLTGLLNRKTFDGSFLDIAAQIASQSAAPPVAPDAAGCDVGVAAARASWLGVIDIDHFKAVNDTHGHLIGDEVLLLVGRLMRSSFRYQDQLYRFGGEEFVVLLRGGLLEHARMAFERLRSNVASYVFPRVGQITISIGFTQIRAGDSPAAAFERADKAVYHAKQSGRDQVAHHGDLLDRGLLVEQSHTGAMELF
ncbi:MAG: diguanylate cyclase [Rubrivivax sp. SCN 71-131]|nr:MAG: diguanylate cyclase [Rubrivivax sp. SCN 71-131]